MTDNRALPKDTGLPNDAALPKDAGLPDDRGLIGDTYKVLDRKEVFRGGIFDVISDQVSMPGATSAQRHWTRHPGAAAVVALDDSGRVVLIRQYRHPIGGFMWEIPAGLMDVTGESGLLTAQRELAEEADLVAARWDLLVDVHTSPGFSDQLVRVYLARDLTAVPDDSRFSREHEEADMTVHRVDLDEAVAMVLRGEITNGADLGGILAAARARDQGWTPLRAADTPPPSRATGAGGGPDHRPGGRPGS